MSDNPFMNLSDNPFAQLSLASSSDETRPTSGPPHYGWEYVLKGDEVTVEFYSAAFNEVIKYTGTVVDIDHERFYIRISSSTTFPEGSNAMFNARQDGVRLVNHLIFHGGAAYQVTDPDADHHPWRDRRRVDITDNPFASL